MLDCGGGRVGYRADLVWSEPSLGGCLKLLQRPSFLPQRSDEQPRTHKNAFFHAVECTNDGFKFRGDDLSENLVKWMHEHSAFDLYALYLFIEPFIGAKTGCEIQVAWQQPTFR